MFKPLDPPPTYYAAFTGGKTYVGDFNEICRFLKRNGLKPEDFENFNSCVNAFRPKNSYKHPRLTINIPSLKLRELDFFIGKPHSQKSFDYHIIKFLRRKFKMPGATQKELLEVINLTGFQQKVLIASRK